MWVSEFLRHFNVLDVGCGDGYGCHYLAERSAAHVLGIDNDPEAIEFAQRRYRRNNLRFLLMDATKISLPPESVDAAISFEVIEHLANPREYLDGICRVLRQEGLLFISTPNRRFTERHYKKGKPRNPSHMREYYPDELQDLLRRFFVIERVYCQFRDYDLHPRKKDLDNYVERCAIPLTIRKLVPLCMKNAWLRMKGLPPWRESEGAWKDYKIVQVNNIHEIDERFPVQLFSCRRSLV